MFALWYCQTCNNMICAAFYAGYYGIKCFRIGPAWEASSRENSLEQCVACYHQTTALPTGSSWR